MAGDMSAEQVCAAVRAAHIGTMLGTLSCLGGSLAEAGEGAEALEAALGGAFQDRCIRFVDPDTVQQGGATERFLDEGLLVGGAPIFAFKLDGCRMGRYVISGRFRVDWRDSKEHLQINGYDLEFMVPGDGDAEDRVVLRLPLAWHFWHDTTEWGISTIWMAKFEAVQSGSILLSGATKPAVAPQTRSIKAGGLLEMGAHQMKVTTDGLEVRRGAGVPHVGSVEVEMPPTDEDTPATVKVIYGSKICDEGLLQVISDGESACVTHDELEARLQAYAAAIGDTLES